MTASEFATNEVVLASERFGVILTDGQHAACVARVVAGEDAAAVVGSLTLTETGQTHAIDTDKPSAPATLEGFAFPLVVVKYHGPTDYRGSRFIATLARHEGMGMGRVTLARVTASYDYAATVAAQGLALARAAWDKYAATREFAQSASESVFVPVDMPDGSNGFVVVPAHMVTVSA